MKELDATHATLSKITLAVGESKETTSMKLAVEADHGPRSGGWPGRGHLHDLRHHGATMALNTGAFAMLFSVSKAIQRAEPGMKRWAVAAILLSSVLFSAQLVDAQMYRWVDPEGRVHYSD